MRSRAILSTAVLGVAGLVFMPACVEDNPFFMETDAPTSTGFVFPTTAEPTGDPTEDLTGGMSSTTGGEPTTMDAPTTDAPTTDAPTTGASSTGSSDPTGTASMTDTDTATSSTGGAEAGSSSSSTGAAT